MLNKRILGSYSWLLLLLFTFACSHSSFKGFQPPSDYGQIKKENISNDTSQNYVLYLPASYSQDKAWRLILLFDSHADGKLAVEKFKEAAEIFGYVLAASNNAGNGIPNTNEIAEYLLTDVSSKINIDKKRVYTAGFSGGGRIALSYAANSGKIKGIITCSAGLANFDPLTVAPKFDVYGIAGLEDFNYKEVTDIPSLLANAGWRNNIALFDGGHAWPPSSFIINAVLWLELNSMKDGLISKNKPLINIAYDSISSSIEKAVAVNRFLLAEQKTQSAISFFTSVKNTKAFKKRLTEIRNMPGYKDETGKDAQVRYQEEELRKGYIDNFTVQDTNWWKNEIQMINKEIAQTNDLLYRQMLSRTKGFLGIISYSYASGAIANKEWNKAERYISVYQVIEPENADCYFFKAILLENVGKHGEALSALKKSIAYGFSEKQKLKANFSPDILNGAGIR